jgi:hypothetical protein
MEQITATATTILANWDSIVGGLLAIIGGCSVIAKLTPTPADDAILAKIVKALDFLALNKQRNPQ